MNKQYAVTYKYAGKIFTSEQKETELYSLKIKTEGNRYTCVLEPKQPFELVNITASFPYLFGKGDKFYAGGYQSWSLSREYEASEIQRGSNKIVNISKFTQTLAYICGDQYMVKYTEKPGEFLSHGYTYIRNGEKVKLFGSLNDKTGFTVFMVKMFQNRFTFFKDLEGKIVSEPLSVFDIVSFEGSYDEVFDSYFGMMKIPETKSGRMCGYTSWYNYFQNINEDIILRDLNALDFAQNEISIFQIDDGYETAVGDWLEDNPEKFPHGMKYVADKIHEKGYKAGIWIAPFSAQRSSNLVKEHPSWFIKDEKGKNALGVIAWQGAYILDVYNEEVREYLRKVFDMVLNNWGFDMVKLDFLYSQCIHPRNGKSRGEIMADAMAFLRECVGDKLFLGCGAPLMSAIGVVDACRIGPDVDLFYHGRFYTDMQLSNEMVSAKTSIINAVFRRHLSARAFMNDPDVFFLRSTNLKFTEEQKYILARINHIFGDVLFVSDNAEEYDEKTKKQFKKFIKKKERKILDAEFIHKGVIKIVYEKNGKRKSNTYDINKGIILFDNKWLNLRSTKTKKTKDSK